MRATRSVDGQYFASSSGSTLVAPARSSAGWRSTSSHEPPAMEASGGSAVDRESFALVRGPQTGQIRPSGAYVLKVWPCRFANTSHRPALNRAPTTHGWAGFRTATTQSELSRLSGVRQPSISQFLSEKVDLSDEQLDRMLERRSWKLHRQLARYLTRSTLTEWQPTIHRNLHRLRTGVTGQPHMRNLDHWQSLLESDDVPGLHRLITGLDRDSIEMREVSPIGGLLPEGERTQILQAAR
jgi:hypothetical protein